MVEPKDPMAAEERLAQELRRGAVVLATLAQVRPRQYGYSLVQRLTERGFEIEPGTLYPMLRRLEEQGLLESLWDVDGARPRKYYRLTDAGAETLARLSVHWRRLAGVMDRLLDEAERGESHGAD